MTTRRKVLLGGAAALTIAAATSAAEAKSAAEIDAGVRVSLRELFAVEPDAEQLYRQAAGVLVIPEVLKAGLVVGGSYGEGALIINDRTQSYWAYQGASVGLQVGAQTTRQILFFMTEAALRDFQTSNGAAIGVDFEATIIDEGGQFGADTITNGAPVIAFVFGRRGLLGGASLGGGEYTPIAR